MRLILWMSTVWLFRSPSVYSLAVFEVECVKYSQWLQHIPATCQQLWLWWSKSSQTERSGCCGGHSWCCKALKASTKLHLSSGGKISAFVVPYNCRRFVQLQAGKKCSIWTASHQPQPISSPLLNPRFSSLHLADLQTTHRVKDWNTQAEGFFCFFLRSQCRKSTWCSSVVKSRIELRVLCSLQRCSLSPLKNKKTLSGQRLRWCLWSWSVMYVPPVFVLRLEVRRLRVDAEGARLENTVRFLTQLSEVSCVHTEWTVTVCKRPTRRTEFHHVAAQTVQICVFPFCLCPRMLCVQTKCPVNKMIYTRGGSFET